MNCNKPKKLIYGVGINDADYATKRYGTIKDADGKSKHKVVWRCPVYVVWMSMLARAYSPKLHAERPTYIGCSIVPEWHRFSVFKAWMEVQDWEGKSLDKDLLHPGNKVYSPDTCIFVSAKVNSFVTESTAARGEWPIGVYYNKQRGKYHAHCGNPFTGKREHLGVFNCPQQAHLAWLQRKRELAKQLAAVQDNPRVAKAIIARYENYEEGV